MTTLLEEPDIKFTQDDNTSLRKGSVESERNTLETSFANIRQNASKLHSQRKYDPNKFKNVKSKIA